jgi:hypothetical protein
MLLSQNRLKNIGIGDELGDLLYLFLRYKRLDRISHGDLFGGACMRHYNMANWRSAASQPGPNPKQISVQDPGPELQSPDSKHPG